MHTTAPTIFFTKHPSRGGRRDFTEHERWAEGTPGGWHREVGDGRRGLQEAGTEKLERDRTRAGVIKMDLERGRCGQRRGGNGQCYPNSDTFCSVTLGKSLNLSGPSA